MRQAIGTLLGLVVGLAAVSHAWAGERREVSFYSSLGNEAQVALVEGVEAALPDIEINWIRAGGVGLYQRFVSERIAGKGKIDLLHSSYAPGWFHLVEQGWVQPVVGELPEVGAFPAEFKDPAGHWVAMRVNTLWMLYNTDRVEPGALPKSWWDLTKPEWRGRIVMVDPLESAGVWDFFYAAPGFGPEFIEALAKNRPLIKRAMGSASESISLGERDLTIVFEYFAIPRIRAGQPLGLHVPADGLPVVPAPIGLPEGGPHPEDARRVLSFILSKEGQTIVTQKVLAFSARRDVPPPPLLKPLHEYRLLHSDWGKVYREQDAYRELVQRVIRRR